MREIIVRGHKFFFIQLKVRYKKNPEFRGRLRFIREVVLVGGGDVGLGNWAIMRELVAVFPRVPPVRRWAFAGAAARRFRHHSDIPEFVCLNAAWSARERDQMNRESSAGRDKNTKQSNYFILSSQELSYATYLRRIQRNSWLKPNADE